jgi:ATP-dependent Lhr-like helicase
LREARRKPREGHYLSLSGSDPLNLVGILTPGARLPALTGNRLLYRDGVPVALLAGGEVEFLTEFAPAEQWEVRNRLLRRNMPAVLAELA